MKGAAPAAPPLIIGNKGIIRSHFLVSRENVGTSCIVGGHDRGTLDGQPGGITSRMEILVTDALDTISRLFYASHEFLATHLLRQSRSVLPLFLSLSLYRIRFHHRFYDARQQCVAKAYTLSNARCWHLQPRVTPPVSPFVRRGQGTLSPQTFVNGHYPKKNVSLSLSPSPQPPTPLK